MNNGYIITYYQDTQWIDQDLLLSLQDAVDHVNVAMEMLHCNCIIVHCVDDGDVLYTRELFFVDGKWMHFHSNNVMNEYTIETL